MSKFAIRDHRSPRPPPKSCGKYSMAPHRGQLSERRHQAVAPGIANREALQEGGHLLSLTPNCGTNTGKTGPVGKASFGSRSQEESMGLFLESPIHLGGGFLLLPQSHALKFWILLIVCLPYIDLCQEEYLVPAFLLPTDLLQTSDPYSFPLGSRSLASRACLHIHMSTEVGPTGEQERSISRTPC